MHTALIVRGGRAVCSIPHFSDAGVRRLAPAGPLCVSSLLVSVAMAVLFGGIAPAFAQTGPAGVGNAAGTGSQPENVLWLRGDAGLVTSGGNVIEWTDQSGNGNTVTDNGSAPAVSAGAINGEDGVSFSNGEFLERTGGSFLTGSDALTMIAVVQAGSIPQDVAFLDSDGDGADGQDDTPSFRYDLTGANSNRVDIFKFGVDVSGGNADQVLESSEVIGTLSTQSTAPRLYTTQWSSGADIRFFLNALEDNATNGTSSNGDTSGGPDLDGSPATGTLVNSDRILLGNGTKGTLGTTGWNGDVVEIIVYRSALNEAQRRIVNAYLVEKYGLTTDSGAEVEPYAFGSTFFEDFAGIGQARTAASTSTRNRVFCAFGPPRRSGRATLCCSAMTEATPQRSLSHPVARSPRTATTTGMRMPSGWRAGGASTFAGVPPSPWRRPSPAAISHPTALDTITSSSPTTRLTFRTIQWCTT